MIDQATTETLLKLFGPYLIKEFLIDIWLIFKATWWTWLIIILLKIFEKWANRKIDIWKLRRRNRKFRGFSKS